ncbi:MAG TPA: hypothetical protein DIW31_05740 [Bacteroidales bacterium]|nr:hypothetical protein [Bacteroidales bacterium]
MRHFETKEKEILKILDSLNGSKFENLLLDKIRDNKLIIDLGQRKAHIRYKTKAFHPDKEEKRDISIQANELHERIYLAVTLVNYFEKQGFIGLFINQYLSSTVEIGNKELDNSGLLTPIIDENINELLVNYTGKVLIITSEFHEFVKNNFIFKEEIRHNQIIKLTWAGIITAISVGIISIGASIWSISNSEVENFHNDFKKYYEQHEILLKKLDSINNSLKVNLEFQKQLITKRPKKKK